MAPTDSLPVAASVPGATTESYRAARERTRSYLAGMSKEDQAKVMGGTAVRVFRFEG